MSSRLITKNSQTPGAAPVSADLQTGELAVNTADGRLFTRHSDGEIKEIGAGGQPAVVEIDPEFTYTAGLVTRIDYASGAHKLFTYTAGVLTQLDYVVGAVTTRKTFTYNPDGSLASITQAVL